MRNRSPGNQGGIIGEWQAIIVRIAAYRALILGMVDRQGTVGRAWGEAELSEACR